MHALVEYPYALVAHAVARRAGVPSIVSAHGTYGVIPLQRLPDRLVYRAALRRAAAVTVPSAYTAGRHGPGDGRVATRRGTPQRRGQRPVRRHASRTTCGPASGSRHAGPLVLSVGHLKRRKGFDVLVQALGIVRADGRRRAILVVVGAGNASLLRQQAADLELGEFVHVVGEVSEPDLVSLYHACDLFALLPRVDNGHFEGFGLVFLEANACGKPVVGTRSGGVPDAIVDGQTGYLVEEDDAAGAAAAMQRVLSDAALAARLGDAGRRWASEHSWHSYAERLVALYRTALRVRRHAQPHVLSPRVHVTGKHHHPVVQLGEIPPGCDRELPASDPR